MATYLKQKVIPWKPGVFLSQLFCCCFPRLHRPSSFPQWSSNNFAPLSAGGVRKRLHAGRMSAIFHWLFINACILKHFPPSRCKTGLTLLSSDLLLIFFIERSMKASNSRLHSDWWGRTSVSPACVLGWSSFQDLSGGGGFGMWREKNEFTASFWTGEKDWKYNLQQVFLFFFFFFFVSVRKMGVFEKHLNSKDRSMSSLSSPGHIVTFKVF